MLLKRIEREMVAVTLAVADIEDSECAIVSQSHITMWEFTILE